MYGNIMIITIYEPGLPTYLNRINYHSLIFKGEAT